jgi:hypothetical protein
MGSMLITITFRSPTHESAAAEPLLHERTIESVPSPKAQEMAADFVEYRKAPKDTSRSKLYRYQTNGDEVLVALDFEEVIALTAAET